jgi:succinyl-diaminopimelate desuccinylase
VLDLSADPVALTAALVDVASVSGSEAALADGVAAALTATGGLAVERDGNVVIARTDAGHGRRLVLAGHLDTVPIAGNVPSRLEGDRLYGCGATDMKSGVAVLLHVAHLVGTGELCPTVDLTFVCYDCEEVEADRNGLGRIARDRPDLLNGDLAILLEPTSGAVEGGCQGTLRAVVRTDGVRAHSARSWLGRNAIHAAADVLRILQQYEAREVEVDGLTYREGLNAVGIAGGIAGNVIPDECLVTVNYRFAPDRSVEQAVQHVRDVFEGYPVEITDSAPGARPGLDTPLAQHVVAAVGGAVGAKLGWTDVARFGELGIPALNLGPGDPDLAHTAGEYVEIGRIRDVAAALAGLLG